MAEKMEVELCGRRRTLMFTVGAAEALEKKAGTLEGLADWLSGGTQMQILSRSLDVLQVLFAEGELYERLQAKYGGTERKDLPIPTTEELKSLYSVQDLAFLQTAIFGAMASGQKQDVESKPVESSGKNASATS